MIELQLRAKSAGCLFGVAIGDALGLPVECQSPDTIRKTYGYVDKYVNGDLHPHLRKKPKGTWSDDTQLTLALMNSLTRKGKYHLPDIRESHIEAMEGRFGKPLGWGRSTRQACVNMKEGKTFTYTKDGAGNGTCMKIAPLAIYYAYRSAGFAGGKYTNSYNLSLLKKCKEISFLTHGDPRTVVAAYCQARMIIRALQNEIPGTSEEIAQLFVEDARYAEEKLPQEFKEPLLSKRIAEFTTDNTCYFYWTAGKVSSMICTNQSSFVCNSYPLVAYCASKYLPYRNFKYAVTETINAGADADSNGSMVAAIVGASLGYGVIPDVWIKGIQKPKMIANEISFFLRAMKKIKEH